MSAKPVVHKATYNKRNLNGWGRMWWTTCTCGYYNGWHEKGDAKACYEKHIEENANA